MSANCSNMTSQNTTGEAFFNPVEGPAMLLIGTFGTLLNVICLVVLSHTNELKLSPNYLCLLRSQSIFDLLYILTSTPITALPYISQTFFYYHLVFILPWVFPFVQITMLASVYNTIALAIERYFSVKNISVHHWFPCKRVLVSITIFSFVISIPRFFELRAVTEEDTDIMKVNNTGVIYFDYILVTTEQHLVKPTADFYTVGYFLGYNLIASFLISLFIPVLTLSIFNLLIWRRLQEIWCNRTDLGVQEKRNTKAALSLVLIIVMFFICHSMKLIISGYQLVNALITANLCFKWPHWMEICTFISHFLLALNSSVNILIFCICDKRFFVIMEKILRSWVRWPFKTFTSSDEQIDLDVIVVGPNCEVEDELEGEGEEERGPEARSSRADSV